MKKFWLWRLTRAYRRIVMLERRLGYTEDAQKLRAAFFSDTWAIAEATTSGRAAKRRMRRNLVKGQ